MSFSPNNVPGFRVDPHYSEELYYEFLSGPYSLAIEDTSMTPSSSATAHDVQDFNAELRVPAFPQNNHNPFRPVSPGVTSPCGHPSESSINPSFSPDEYAIQSSGPPSFQSLDLSNRIKEQASGSFTFSAAEPFFTETRHRRHRSLSHDGSRFIDGAASFSTSAPLGVAFPPYTSISGSTTHSPCLGPRPNTIVYGNHVSPQQGLSSPTDASAHTVEGNWTPSINSPLEDQLSPHEEFRSSFFRPFILPASDSQRRQLPPLDIPPMSPRSGSLSGLSDQSTLAPLTNDYFHLTPEHHSAGVKSPSDAGLYAIDESSDPHHGFLSNSNEDRAPGLRAQRLEYPSAGHPFSSPLSSFPHQQLTRNSPSRASAAVSYAIKEETNDQLAYTEVSWQVPAPPLVVSQRGAYSFSNISEAGPTFREASRGPNGPQGLSPTLLTAWRNNMVEANSPPDLSRGQLSSPSDSHASRSVSISVGSPQHSSAAQLSTAGSSFRAVVTSPATRIASLGNRRGNAQDRFRCGYCGTTLTAKHNYYRHINSHFGRKPFR
ncbi:hypothetical protein HGRIS_004427 [Hohenbuehelia grisea]|uniref:C2H2-type domain-containing protein n=1 Tax=Hohenbuehelia grisea TaxID=104357 RepID=A0ABR3JC78_9AGAR